MIGVAPVVQRLHPFTSLTESTVSEYEEQVDNNKGFPWTPDETCVIYLEGRSHDECRHGTYPPVCQANMSRQKTVDAS